ncbi:MAG: hypothetical protein L0H55_16555 [Candidatus Nitrosocosmicus sp.]|nr:hypothetical protein [Candidatus Nitrosocosmicus sp.]
MSITQYPNNKMIIERREKGIEIDSGYNNKIKSRVIKIINIQKISSYRSSSSDIIPEPDETIIERQSGSENKDTNEQYFPETDTNDSKTIDIYKTDKPFFQDSIKTTNPKDSSDQQEVSIYDIADRMYEHRDTWICKTCTWSGDKWEILNHYPFCKNNKK